MKNYDGKRIRAIDVKVMEFYEDDTIEFFKLNVGEDMGVIHLKFGDLPHSRSWWKKHIGKKIKLRIGVGRDDRMAMD